MFPSLKIDFLLVPGLIPPLRNPPFRVLAIKEGLTPCIKFDYIASFGFGKCLSMVNLKASSSILGRRIFKT